MLSSPPQRMFLHRNRLLVLGPRVTQSQRELATPWSLRLLSGFFCLREVRFDTRLEAAFFLERTFWFFRKTRVVRFGDVDHVAYSFKGLPTSWNILGRMHDSVESFSISLALKESGQVLFVTRFVGEGFAGDFGTWMMGDGLVDLAGTQEEDSRVFVTSLCKVLGVGLGPKLEAAPDADGLKWSCSGCGRWSRRDPSVSTAEGRQSQWRPRTSRKLVVHCAPMRRRASAPRGPISPGHRNRTR